MTEARIINLLSLPDTVKVYLRRHWGMDEMGELCEEACTARPVHPPQDNEGMSLELDEPTIESQVRDKIKA